MNNLRQVIEKELTLAYKNGKNAGSPSGSLPTMNDVVDVCADQIENMFFTEVIARATVPQLARAMGQVRLGEIPNTPPSIGRCIWELQREAAEEDFAKLKDMYPAPEKET